MGKLTPETLHKLQRAPQDQFGVTHHELLYNKQENKLFCVLDAPTKEAVKKHHAHAGITCDWVEEVASTTA
jgi:hypothetical protein